MRPTTVINHFNKELEHAKNQEWIRKPISYALYQTWRWADINEPEREINTEHKRGYNPYQE